MPDKSQQSEISRIAMLSVSAAAKAVKRDKNRIYQAIRDNEIVPIVDRGVKYITVWQLEEWQRGLLRKTLESQICHSA